MKFLQIIDSSFIGRFVHNRLNVLEHTDPDRIYVENVRQFYGLPTPLAKLLCEMAVKQNLFTKHVALECPNEGRLLATATSVDKLPAVVTCFNCEVNEEERYEFTREECHKVEFYKLNRR